MSNKIQRIKYLVEGLNKHSYNYYVLDNPTISDKEYDNLYDELQKLENETGLILSNSPTQKVGYEVKSKLEKVNHNTPLKSLDKTKDINVLKKFLGDREGVLMLKLDGLTTRLDYDNELILGGTRGNGTIGELITHNVKTFKNIPLKINNKLSVSGEAIINKQDFESINKLLSDNEKYKTPRNLVAGSVRQLSNKICSNRNVRFYAFNVLDGEDFKTKSDQLEYLKFLGFDVVEYRIVNKDNLEESINYLKEYAISNGLPIDGLVLTYNDIEYGLSLGETSHHPLHSIAFKFYDEEQETILRDIEWNVGRTGVVTPVAIFDAIELDGTEVTRASIHNLSILKQLELGINDNITVFKANQIIPQIKENLTRSNNIIIPDKCPTCGHSAVITKSDQAEFLYCSNSNCNAKLIQRINHYCSKNAMNIVGLSEATIEKFIEKGFIKDITDLYRLEEHRNEIIKMEGFGLKSYNNLIKSINESKRCRLENFIFALGIPQVGLSTAKDLANKFETFDNFAESLSEGYDLIQLKDIGEVTNQEIHKWWDETETIESIADILLYIEFIREDKKEIIVENKENPLFNKHVYPTGTFTLKKAELKVKLEELGAIVESGYKKSLDYLICANDISKSGKADKAIKDGVKIMSENELMEFIK